MAAGRLDLLIEKGSTFQKTLTWKTRDPSTGLESLVDLTSYSARAQFRETHEDPLAFFSLTEENGGIELNTQTGEITLKIPAETSSQVPYSSGVWDLEVFQGTDTVIRLVEGKVRLTPEVTR
jgi:hypothetical protein